MATSKSDSAHCNKAPGSCSHASAPNQPFPSKSKQTTDKKKPAYKHCYREEVSKQKKKHTFMASSKSNSAPCNKTPGAFSRDSVPCNKTPWLLFTRLCFESALPFQKQADHRQKKSACKHCYREKVRQTKKETHLHDYPNGRSCFPTGFVALTTNSIECRLEARPMLQEITSPSVLFFRRRDKSDAAKNF